MSSLYNTTKTELHGNKCLLHILCENLNPAENYDFIHRLIYIGKYTFDQSEIDNFSLYNEKAINEINKDNAVLTGLLLTYSKHFCHVIEGNELVIHKHLKTIFNGNDFKNKIGFLKMLICQHHIKNRILPVWMHISVEVSQNAVSNLLNEKITEISSEQIKLFIRQFFKLADFIKTGITKESIKQVPVSSNTVKMFNITEDLIPQLDLLEYLTNNESIPKLKDYFLSFGCVPLLLTYMEESWPPETDWTSHFETKSIKNYIQGIELID